MIVWMLTGNLKDKYMYMHTQALWHYIFNLNLVKLKKST